MKSSSCNFSVGGSSPFEPSQSGEAPALGQRLDTMFAG